MRPLKNVLILVIAVAVFSLNATSVDAATGKETKEKFSGEFWNKGQHFQLHGKIVPLGEDGIHDPANETAMVGLQPPVDAMREFPRDSAGLLDWVKSLSSGVIEPRSDMFGIVAPTPPLDLDIVFTNTGAMPNVLFPHRQHTEWLDCVNCHPAIFEQKKGANKFKMADVLGGKYCGVCHGKVAFAPTLNCMRCHSLPAAKKTKQ